MWVQLVAKLHLNHLAVRVYVVLAVLALACLSLTACPSESAKLSGHSSTRPPTGTSGNLNHLGQLCIHRQ
jgi:hypothetical protein